ncbi:MAG: hypothetical protein HKN30_18205 [Sulfitobacter sp.]|nr:hypothetical protein [Sulfitobacter sp.]
MGRALNILLLAGSAEARQIARGLMDRGYRVEALVSEMPRGSVPMPMPFTLTDFTDFRPLVHRMKGFGAVLDASHGFDAAMTETGFAAARERGLPFLSLRRPGWSLMEDPLWQSVPDVAAAMPIKSRQIQ